MSGKLLLGTAKVDITPDRPIPLAGFGHRKGPFEGINRRLFVRVNCFGQTDGHTTRKMIVAMGDIIWWGSERMERIRKTIREKWGIREQDIILSAQHTHGGPSTSTLFLDALGIPDEAYLNRLDELLFEAVEQAAGSMEPVTAERGSGECRIGINRRKMQDGKMTMAPNPDGLLDPVATVFRFRKENGKTKAVLIHYTCHPTTTNINFVHSDYPGVAAERLEGTFGGETVVTFLQGCTGNVRPALVRDGKFYSGTDDDVRRLGKALADTVEQVLEGPMEPLSPAPFDSKQIVVQLPFQTLPGDEDIDAAISKGGAWAEWGERLRRKPELLRPHIPFELTRLDIADGLSFIAMNGEVVLEYGMFIKEETKGKVLPLGYANGMVGYVPTAAQIAEGGYEAKDSSIYFALPAPFDPSIETIIRQGITQLIRKED
jgi:hypothetical protein